MHYHMHGGLAHILIYGHMQSYCAYNFHKVMQCGEKKQLFSDRLENQEDSACFLWTFLSQLCVQQKSDP